MSNQVFRYCSDSGYFSQNSLKVLLAKILSILKFRGTKIDNSSHSGNFSENIIIVGLPTVRVLPKAGRFREHQTISSRQFSKNPMARSIKEAGEDQYIAWMRCIEPVEI